MENIMKKNFKKEDDNKIKKPSKNKGKKYDKPLSLYGIDFETVVKIALKSKPQNKAKPKN